jgi:hypothetical protein
MRKLGVFGWRRRFKEGREAVEGWQPKTQKTEANVSRVRTLVGSDQRLCVSVIAELNINRERVRQIVKEDFGMRKISTKMVSRILTHDQKQSRLHISSIFYAMQRCLIGSLPVIKSGVFNMTRKQNDKAYSGKHRIHLSRKKHACLGRRSRACLCVCMITRGQFTVNCMITRGQFTVNCMITSGQFTVNCMITRGQFTVNCMITNGQFTVNCMITSGQFTMSSLHKDKL